MSITAHGCLFCVQLKFPAVPWSAKKSRISQPDLDYVAPEVQLETAPYATTACDLFALGSLICAVYNAGNTPISAAYNLSTYTSHVKQVMIHVICCTIVRDSNVFCVKIYVCNSQISFEVKVTTESSNIATYVPPSPSFFPVPILPHFLTLLLGRYIKSYHV